MFCPNCRTVNDNKFRYCYHCGFSLPTLPVEDNSIVPIEPSHVETPAPVAEPVPVEIPIPAQQTQPAPQPAPVKKGRLLPPLLLLIAMMAIGLLAFFANPRPVQEPEPTEEPISCFTVNNGVLSFDESTYDGDSELEVPSDVNGQTITVIGKGCFKECRSLTTVILPDTVTEIRQQAFSDCTNLRGIFIPEGVKAIDAAAFHNCLAMEAIHLPNSLEELDSRAFSRCKKLAHIFYAGTYEDWTELYTGVLPADAWIYCQDGKYPYTQQ